jgi:hypothetical protein
MVPKRPAAYYMKSLIGFGDKAENAQPERCAREAPQAHGCMGRISRAEYQRQDRSHSSGLKADFRGFVRLSSQLFTVSLQERADA